MRKLLFIALGLLVITSCSKIKPKKVKRNLAGTEWNLVSYVVGEDSKATTLTSYTYKFEDGLELVVKTDQELKGSWDVSLDDDPSVLYLYLPEAAGLEVLTDDYKILDFDDSYMRLESIGKTSEKTTTLVFRK